MLFLKCSVTFKISKASFLNLSLSGPFVGRKSNTTTGLQVKTLLVEAYSKQGIILLIFLLLKFHRDFLNLALLISHNYHYP